MPLPDLTTRWCSALREPNENINIYLYLGAYTYIAEFFHLADFSRQPSHARTYVCYTLAISSHYNTYLHMYARTHIITRYTAVYPVGQAYNILYVLRAAMAHGARVRRCGFCASTLQQSIIYIIFTMHIIIVYNM